ncbi:uncharacterized protein LOC134719719 [Mytilus trossulus]|uniref:uncharacterized protein LOC134719719 n=1 Tax=Mytilus trossulus TaxID=6551 RepID=UPI0030066FBC
MAAILMQCSECDKIYADSDAFNNHLCIQNTSSVEEVYTEPIGPISTLVPSRFHRLMPKQILKSYLSSSHSYSETFAKMVGPADIPVITKKRKDEVYDHIMSNLSEDGKIAVKEIEPWVFNTLIDWSTPFEHFVCTAPLPDNSEVFKQIEPVTMATAQSSQSSVKANWSKAASLSLIGLHQKHQTLFEKPSVKKKDVWLKISKAMAEKNYLFNPAQCEQKWKNLTKVYRDTVDHNRKTGNERKECAFFEELEECYGYRPNVTPLYTMGSNAELSSSSQADIEFNQKQKEDSAADLEVPVPKKKKTNSTNEDVMKLLATIKDDQHELVNVIKKQHDDKMNQEGKKLELLEKMINTFANTNK